MASQKNIAIDLGARVSPWESSPTGPRDVLVLEQYASSDLFADPVADATRLDQCQAAIGALSKSLKVKGPAQYAVTSQSVFTRFVKLPPSMWISWIKSSDSKHNSRFRFP